MKKVIVHIDRLVLNGFEGSDRDAIAEGLRQELGELLVNSESSKNLADLSGNHRMRAGNVLVGHGAKPLHVGKLIAGGIAKGGRR